MIDPMRCIPDFLRRVISGPGAFYDIRHQVIGSTLVTMYDNGLTVDLITVQQRLRDEGQIAAIGGLPYLIEITESVPSAANLPHYVGQVLEKLKLRKLLDAYNKKREQLGIEPPGAVLFWFSRTDHTDDATNIFVTSNGDGTYLARQFTGPLFDLIGSQEQDELDRKDNLTPAEALQIAREWQEELEEE